MRLPSVLLPLLALAACAGAPSTGIDTSADANFCDTPDDASAWNQEEGGGDGSSGELDLLVINDAVEDPHQPEYVAYKNYTLEPTETGGVQTPGQTSGDGIVSQKLGAGQWTFKASTQRGPDSCHAEMEFPIGAGKTTHACALMSCE